VDTRNLRIEDERPEVMLPLEQATLRVYAGEPGLTDRDVGAAYGALITHYRALERGLTPQHRLPPASQRLLEELLPAADTLLREDVADMPLLVRGLTRLRKSVTFWSNRGGRQGYLNAMSELVPQETLPPTGRLH
jgi:hypothetical protein